MPVILHLIVRRAVASGLLGWIAERPLLGAGYAFRPFIQLERRPRRRSRGSKVMTVEALSHAGLDDLVANRRALAGGGLLVAKDQYATATTLFCSQLWVE